MSEDNASKPGGDKTSQIPQAQDILDAIKEIWDKGNASYLDIEKQGKTVLHISLTVGAIGLVIAPVAALIGLGAALITDFVIKITLDNGTVINVNEFVASKGAESGVHKTRDVSGDDNQAE